jgi:hypothetical protein
MRAPIGPFSFIVKNFLIRTPSVLDRRQEANFPDSKIVFNNLPKKCSTKKYFQIN